MSQVPEQKDFFISYNKTDKDWAEWIAWQLEEAGYSTTIQAWDFRAGGNFVLDMQKATTNCKRTIAVLSPNYLSSKFTAPEWAAAFSLDPTGEQQKLLPVRVKECNPQGLLGPIIYTDLVGKAAATARKLLLDAVKVDRLKPTRPVPFPGEKSRKKATPPAFPAIHSSKASTSNPQIKKKQLSEANKLLAETKVKKAFTQTPNQSNKPAWLKIVWGIPGSDELLDPVRFTDKKFSEAVVHVARSGEAPLFDLFRQIQPLPLKVDYFGLEQASEDRNDEPTQVTLHRDGTIVISLATLHKPITDFGSFAQYYIDPELVRNRLEQAWNFATRWWDEQDPAQKYNSFFYNLALYNIEGCTVGSTPSGKITSYNFPGRGKPDPLIVYDKAQLIERNSLNSQKLISHSVEMLKLRFNSV